MDEHIIPQPKTMSTFDGGFFSAERFALDARLVFRYTVTTDRSVGREDLWVL